jgi:Flp pilus assembly pilin Flp
VREDRSASGNARMSRHSSEDARGDRRILAQQRGQALVEYALILALIILVVIIALLLTGNQVTNLYSNITATMCNYRIGC